MVDIKREAENQPGSASAVETEGTRNRKVYVPRVDIYETKDAMVLIADMPGVDEKSVNITLERNVLTIRGQVAMEHYKGYSLGRAEYDLGDYERSFTLSDSMDGDRIDAAMKNGVLRLTLPKAEPAKAKKIAVKAA